MSKLSAALPLPHRHCLSNHLPRQPSADPTPLCPRPWAATCRHAAGAGVPVHRTAPSSRPGRRQDTMTNQIQLGLVTDVVPIEEIAEGWDFYEIPNSVHIRPMHSEADWIANRDRYRARGVPTPVASHYV